LRVPLSCNNGHGLKNNLLERYPALPHQKQVPGTREDFAMAILSRIFADKPSRETTLILSAAGVAALAAGCWIGGGNSPTGALLLFAGSVFVILACTYRWQEIKKFRYPTFSSLAGFFVFAVPHTVFEAFAGSTESPGLLSRRSPDYQSGVS
jgi:hypothetical protein